MKAFNKILLAMTVAAPLALTGCLDETFPTDEVTNEQLEGNAMALDAQVGGIPSYMKTLNVWRDTPTDFAYPSQMIIRDLLCQDMIQVYNSYQHFSSFQSISVVINEDYLLNQIVWYYYNLQVQKANAVIEIIDPSSANDTELNLLGQALTFRALTYLDMARLYEFLPNSVSSPVTSYGNNVSGLTVPITDPRKPVDPAKNPRATHEQMFDFILADLDEAQGYFQINNARNDKTRPDLSVVYGLKARLYMWDENYPKAAEFAKLAQSGYTPLTASEWLNPTTGFNDMNSQNSWMLAISQSKEDDCVQDYSNWTSFMSSEGAIGYGEPMRHGNPMVADVSFYEQISNNDFRKLSWKAPGSSPLASQNIYAFESQASRIRTYASLKFRNGEGSAADNNICWATDIPLMRVEEMMLIEAEATAQTNPAAGRQLLINFMTQYRNPSYSFAASDKEEVIDEIFFQKRVELWGEGQIIFDFKRLNKGVTRKYDGSNWPEDSQYNTIGRPAWMNFVMCGFEGELNSACLGWNNPDVGGRDSY